MLRIDFDATTEIEKEKHDNERVAENTNDLHFVFD